MKKTLSYIAPALMAAAALTSCNDNFERPPMVMPVSNLKANTTIAELKQTYWSADRNYVSTVGMYDGSKDEHIVIKGRVASESASGNIYNSIILQDETGAINIAVVAKDITSTPMFGQELIIDVTDLKIGGYNSLMQLGAEGTYNGAPSMTFMTGATYDAHAFLNGLAQPELVDTLTVTAAELVQAKSSSEGLIKWQSQLIRLTDVTFETPGKPFAEDKNTDRYVKDANGNRINVRTSSYASFKNDLTPTGTGDIVGILSYYGSDWQILLNDITGVIGFDEAPETPDTPDTPTPGAGDGTEGNPYTVAQVIGGQSGTGVWTKGYIVGWVEGMTLADGAHFDNKATVATNILIAATPDAKEVKDCVPVQLPSGGVRSALNLQNNPGNFGKEVMLKGDFEKYFGTAGIKNTSNYKIEGGETPDTPDTPGEPVASIDQNFDASTNIPAGWTQVQVSGDKAWYIATYQENNYASMTGFKGTKPPFDQYLITPGVDMSKATVKTLSFRTQFAPYGSKTSIFEVYVLNDADPTKATVKDKLQVSLPTSATSIYSDWVQSGQVDLSKYTGTIYIAFRYYATQDANYATWCVDDVKVNVK